MTQQYPLASMAAWLSSTGISHHDPLPHIPFIHLSSITNNHHPRIAPQSLHSSSQLLQLLGDLHPSLGYIWLRHGVSDSHSVLGYHRSAASLSALNVSPLTQKIALMQRLDPASVHPPARVCGVQSF